MKRENKYPETQQFVFQNVNPRGKFTADCVIRAIAGATGLDYDLVLMMATVVQIETGYAMNTNEGINALMKKLGWEKQKQPRKDDNTKYTGKEWCDYLSINDKHALIGPIVANIGGSHTVCIKPTNHGDGYNCRYKVHDTWNSTRGCIGMFWVKKDSVEYVSLLNEGELWMI